jgi:16S rRNA G966 N2-methylase RsmD
MNADYHMDALDFVDQCKELSFKFSTVILDPPYSYRKCMTKYNGMVSSPFNQIKNKILNILEPNGITMTMGYHSNSMGKRRGFEQEHILLMSHGGAIHDTILSLERWDNGLSREEIETFFPAN